MTRSSVRLPEAIVTLQDEHRYMNLLLKTLEDELQKSGPGGAEDYFLMQDIVRYMHEYPDAVHHPTEDLMFDKLVVRDPAAAASVQRLRRDHEMLTENTAELMRLLDSASEEQTPDTAEAVREAATNYINRLRRHMRREEGELFPHAVRCLANKDWRSIETRLNAVDDPLFGSTVDREHRVLYEFFSERAGNMSRGLTSLGFLQLDNMIVGADALEKGIAELWTTLQGHAESLARETRGTVDQVFSGQGVVAAVGAQAKFAAFLVRKAVDVGSDSAGITLRTLRRMATPFCSNSAPDGRDPNSP